MEERLTCPKLPEAHRRRGRTTNGLERLMEEARCRTKVQGVLAGEEAGLSLIYALTVDVAKRRRGIRITPGDLEKLHVLREEVAPRKATVWRCENGVAPAIRVQKLRGVTIPEQVHLLIPFGLRRSRATWL